MKSLVPYTDNIASYTTPMKGIDATSTQYTPSPYSSQETIMSWHENSESPYEQILPSGMLS